MILETCDDTPIDLTTFGRKALSGKVIMRQQKPKGLFSLSRLESYSNLTRRIVGVLDPFPRGVAPVAFTGRTWA